MEKRIDLLRLDAYLSMNLYDVSIIKMAITNEIVRLEKQNQEMLVRNSFQGQKKYVNDVLIKKYHNMIKELNEYSEYLEECAELC